MTGRVIPGKNSKDYKNKHTRRHVSWNISQPTSCVTATKTNNSHERIRQNSFHGYALLLCQQLGLLVGLQQGAQLALFPAQGLVVGKSVESDPTGSFLGDGVQTDGEGVVGDPLDLGRSVVSVLVLRAR
jgi:hypothetical protein